MNENTPNHEQAERDYFARWGAEPAAPAREPLTEEQIKQAVFALLKQWKDERAWDKFTRESGPYDSTELRVEVLEICRAVERAVLAGIGAAAPAAQPAANTCRAKQIGPDEWACDCAGGPGPACDAVRTAAPAAQPVPEGFVLVPLEPSKDMLMAAVKSRYGDAVYKVSLCAIEEEEAAEDYRAMLAASPTAQEPTNG